MDFLLQIIVAFAAYSITSV